MHIKEYDIIYLNDVKQNLGNMLEYTTTCNFDPTKIWAIFCTSNAAQQIQNGNPAYLAGYSGHELLRIITQNISNLDFDYASQNAYLQSKNLYWTGYVLAHLQYETCLSFFKLNELFPISKIIDLYSSFHKLDISVFINYAKKKIKRENTITNLKLIRKARGLSQAELAKMAKVDLRSIQMYEQRNNDINKAQAQTLYNISKILGCRMEDLLEY